MGSSHAKEAAANTDRFEGESTVTRGRYESANGSPRVQHRVPLDKVPMQDVGHALKARQNKTRKEIKRDTFQWMRT